VFVHISILSVFLSVSSRYNMSENSGFFASFISLATSSGIGVIFLGGEGSRDPDPQFLEWEDGPLLYKYTKSEILLGPPHFSDQSYATV